MRYLVHANDEVYCIVLKSLSVNTVVTMID
jgi:hypothetical protein